MTTQGRETYPVILMRHGMEGPPRLRQRHRPRQRLPTPCRDPVRRSERLLWPLTTTPPMHLSVTVLERQAVLFDSLCQNA